MADGLDLINAYRQAFGKEPLKAIDPPGAIKPWVIFQYDQYYPSGGWHDFHSRWETEEEADAEVARLKALPPYLEQKAQTGKVEYGYDYYDVVNVLTASE